MANKLNKLISGRFSAVVFLLLLLFFVSFLFYLFRGLIGGKNDRYV